MHGRLWQLALLMLLIGCSQPAAPDRAGQQPLVRAEVEAPDTQPDALDAQPGDELPPGPPRGKRSAVAPQEPEPADTAAAHDVIPLELVPFDLAGIGRFLTIDAPPDAQAEWDPRDFTVRWSEKLALSCQAGPLDVAARLAQMQADERRPVQSIVEQSDDALLVEILNDGKRSYWFEVGVPVDDAAYHIAPKETWVQYSQAEAKALLAAVRTLRRTAANRQAEKTAAQATAILRKAGATVDHSGPDLYVSFYFDTPVDPRLFAELSKLPQLSWVQISNSSNFDEQALALLADATRLKRLDIESSPLTDAGLEPIGRLKNLRILGIKRTNITGAGLRHLAGLDKIEHLELDANDLDDAGIAGLGPMPRLKYLALNETPLGDAALEAIGRYTRLDYLLLRGTQVAGPGFAHLSELQELNWLDLDNTPFNDAGLPHLAKLADLEQLRLAGTQVAGPGLKALRPLARLHYLDIGRSKVDGPGLAGLAGLPRLSSLNLDELPLDDEALLQLNDLPELSSLWLRNVQIKGSTLEHLKEFPKLDMLLIGQNQIEDPNLAQLQALPALRSLYANEMSIGDAGLELLAGCPKLESLDVTQTKVTAAGVEAFKQSKPKCYVSFTQR